MRILTILRFNIWPLKRLRLILKAIAGYMVTEKDQWLAILRGYHIVIDLTTATKRGCWGQEDEGRRRKLKGTQAASAAFGQAMFHLRDYHIPCSQLSSDMESCHGTVLFKATKCATSWKKVTISYVERKLKKHWIFIQVLFDSFPSMYLCTICFRSIFLNFSTLCMPCIYTTHTPPPGGSEAVQTSWSECHFQ